MSPELAEKLKEADVSVLEPRHFYDQFIIGIGQKGHDIFAVYDKNAMLEEMTRVAKEEEDDPEVDVESETIEHFDFNMNQGGDGYPAYVELDRTDDWRALLMAVVRGQEYDRMEAEGKAAEALGLTWDDGPGRWVPRAP